MKISEVINSLESYLKEKGDLNIYKWSEEGELEAPSIIDMYNDLKDSDDRGNCYPEIPEGIFILIQ
jgi:hypothetical protein